MKEYEREINSRPYRIYWHNKFLRSYETQEDMENGLLFFNKFLISITHKLITQKGK